MTTEANDDPGVIPVNDETLPDPRTVSQARLAKEVHKRRENERDALRGDRSDGGSA